MGMPAECVLAPAVLLPSEAFLSVIMRVGLGPYDVHPNAVGVFVCLQVASADVETYENSAELAPGLGL